MLAKVLTFRKADDTLEVSEQFIHRTKRVANYALQSDVIEPKGERVQCSDKLFSD